VLPPLEAPLLADKPPAMDKLDLEGSKRNELASFTVDPLPWADLIKRLNAVPLALL
jgi:hypothetical protein